MTTFCITKNWSPLFRPRFLLENFSIIYNYNNINNLKFRTNIIKLINKKYLSSTSVNFVEHYYNLQLTSASTATTSTTTANTNAPKTKTTTSALINKYKIDRFLKSNFMPQLFYCHHHHHRQYNSFENKLNSLKYITINKMSTSSSSCSKSSSSSASSTTAITTAKKSSTATTLDTKQQLVEDKKDEVFSIEEGDEEQTKKLGIFAKFKLMYKQYWYVLLPVHVITSTGWLFGFYYLSKSGVDIPSLLHSISISDSIIDKIKDSSMGHLAISYMCYKLVTPIRYMVTVGGTTVSIKYLSQWGYIRPIPSKAQFKKMYDDRKTKMKSDIEQSKFWKKEEK